MKHNELLKELEYIEHVVESLRKRLGNAPVVPDKGNRDRDKEYKIIETMVKSMGAYEKKTFLAMKLGYNNYIEAAHELGSKKFDDLYKERFG